MLLITRWCRCTSSRIEFFLLPSCFEREEPGAKVGVSLDRVLTQLIFLCLLDIDECSRGSHSCQHNCRNFPGSYFCSCKRGFRLTNDLKTCVGK